MQVIEATDTASKLANAMDWGDPSSWTEKTVEELFALDRSEVEALQLKWTKERLAHLKSRLPALKTLVDKQGGDDIDDLNGLTPFLFTHKVYKSYPLSLIEKKQFGLLTQWLDKLTTHNLSSLDVTGVNTIDSWLERLDEKVMFMCHSTGTTGKLSFFPRSQVEKDNFLTSLYKAIEASSGKDMRNERMPVFFPGYRGGSQVSHKVLYHVGQEVGSGGEEFHTLFDRPMSADFISLAGRLKAAQASGNLKRMDMVRALVKSKGELIKLKKQQPKMMEAFMDKLVNGYHGRRVLVMATTPDLLKPALEGRSQGISNIFSEDSILITGGGLKGYGAPDNWPEILKEFYGVKEFYMLYGMTEMTPINPVCKNGHYHFFPYLVPYVLDVETGEPLPREGVQTGRFGFFDLLAETYWGGLLTGDRVTIHHEDCGCGWQGAWLEDNIQRYSDLQEDKEDKISCAGSQEAYSEFLDYITEDIE